VEGINGTGRGVQEMLVAREAEKRYRTQSCDWWLLRGRLAHGDLAELQSPDVYEPLAGDVSAERVSDDGPLAYPNMFYGWWRGWRG